MHVLILGGGLMQLPAIRTARALDWRVSVADGNADCAGRSLADTFIHVDLKDKEGLLRSARKLVPPINGAFTAGTDFSLSVAHITENLGLPGTSLRGAANATDKYQMRRVLSECGIAVPRFTDVRPADRPETVKAKADQIGLPLVVKPVDNMGARGVRRIDSQADLAGAVTEARDHSMSGRIVLEELIAGREFSVDALVFDDKVHVTGIANRHIYFPPYFVEMGHTIPAEESSDVLDRITGLFVEAVRALGITHGAAKGDVFLSPDGPVIGEVAARLSGGFMSGWTYPNSSGVNLTKLALGLSVGIRPEESELVPTRTAVSAERALISVPGTVWRVANNAVAAARVTDVFVKAKAGEVVDPPTNNVEKMANVITCGNSRAEAVESALAALNRIDVDLKPGDARTDEFLFSHGFRSRFRPYELENTDVESLPPIAGERDRIARVLEQGNPIPVIDRSGAVTSRYPVPTARDVFSRCVDDGLIVPAGEGLDGFFWRCFVSGGRQAVRYLFHSISQLNATGLLAEWTNKWIGW